MSVRPEGCIPLLGMATTDNQLEEVRQLARDRGAIRPRDLAELGLPREYLHRLWQAGELERVARGLYVSLEGELSQHHSLVQASRLAPQGVVCLLSALRFHEIGTQEPNSVWLALPRGAWTPRTELRLKVVHLSPMTHRAGIEEHDIEGVTVRVYNPAKTIADCFRFRRRVGLDVALEALREAWRERRLGVEQLWRYAELDRVANVMQPYLEMLTCGG